jgi:hypothetical protein
MPENKTVTYTIVLDTERYNSLPFMGYGGTTYPRGSFEATAKVLMIALGHPKEVSDMSWWEFYDGNYKAILKWLDSLDFIGTKPLFVVNDPTQLPISWTVKTQIKGIP